MIEGTNKVNRQSDDTEGGSQSRNLDCTSNGYNDTTIRTESDGWYDYGNDAAKAAAAIWKSDG
jgi:hypothetical protein